MADSNNNTKLGDGLKNILLAGIGAVATTAEKSQEVLDRLVEKGEITVEQGKALNQELKHKAEEAKKEAQARKDASAEEDKVVDTVAEEVKEAPEEVKEESADDLAAKIQKLSPEEKAKLKDLLGD